MRDYDPDFDTADLANEAAEALEKLKAELAEERRIVDRIWAIFGPPAFEDLKGKSIYDLVTDLKLKFEAALECWIDDAQRSTNPWPNREIALKEANEQIAAKLKGKEK